jgi:hypothetical protein
VLPAAGIGCGWGGRRLCAAALCCYSARSGGLVRVMLVVQVLLHQLLGCGALAGVQIHALGNLIGHLLQAILRDAGQPMLC